jgi:hypothetical protein
MVPMASKLQEQQLLLLQMFLLLLQQSEEVDMEMERHLRDMDAGVTDMEKDLGVLSGRRWMPCRLIKLCHQ